VNERRQRPVRALVTGLVILGVLAVSSGCEVRSSVEGAQTAVAVAQTALPMAQTVMPGFQATVQAGATLAVGVMSDPQAVKASLQVLLGGSTVDLKSVPTGAPNDAVTQLTISATDTRGTFGQLDARTRQAAGGAAMLLVAQSYPKAAVSLTVIDSTGGPLVSGTKAPGEAPSLQ
jgi:hypothetical protein